MFLKLIETYNCHTQKEKSCHWSVGVNDRMVGAIAEYQTATEELTRTLYEWGNLN